MNVALSIHLQLDHAFLAERRGDEMLVLKSVDERTAGEGLEGVIHFDEDDSDVIWTFTGRELIETKIRGDRRIVPLVVRHLDKLHALGLIDREALWPLHCVAVQ